MKEKKELKLETKEKIMQAAYEEFAAKGFDKSSIRGIAKKVESDPALLYYYYSNKEELFYETMKNKIDEINSDAALGQDITEDYGTVIVNKFLEYWGDPDQGSPLLSLMYNLYPGSSSHKILHRFVTEIIGPHVSRRNSKHATELAVSLATSQLLGLLLVRNILCLEPIASMPTDEISRFVGPILGMLMTNRFEQHPVTTGEGISSRMTRG